MMGVVQLILYHFRNLDPTSPILALPAIVTILALLALLALYSNIPCSLTSYTIQHSDLPPL